MSTIKKPPAGGFLSYVFHFVERDVRFARDVRLRRAMRLRAWEEHITSLCGTAAKHRLPQANIAKKLSVRGKWTESEAFSMPESRLRELSMEFSVQIIALVKDLKARRESVIANQIGRSGTSIGANIYEAKYAQGTKDFVSKLEIALKEASETGYWLELLYRTGYIDEAAFHSLNEICSTIRIMLIASCRTVKSKENQTK